ncbi:glycosyltransferase [Rhodopirellula sp. MGV]|uniref:glycosyltransferase n=1 Tax=Rhodopirellula sp. MGV TaxID=2023130 RepID=UPI000B9696A3|nr:glycosyltransferase [Rhodopirellula sp. MGV]OYP34753.1 glycosyl transferase family 1 [Rhodopirellula sp. MGV]PNY34371.1 glycosyl transferase family 1 [Rhodopirellula baltica]
MRCQFVITSMPVGGAETLLVNMLRRFDPAVVRPEVICLKDPGPLGEQIAEEFPLYSNLIGGKWDARVAFRLAKRMRHADVVITVGAGDKMFWGRLAAFMAGVPVIASALHSTGWPDGVGRLNRMLTPITDAFIAVADSHGKFLHEFERFPEHKVHVIRNGVDCERFRPDHQARLDVRAELGLASDTPLVGIVAALRSEKNHGLLVRAAAKLHHHFPDLHWLIVGDGPERDSIESLATELGVRERIRLLGTRHDTPNLVAALDVFTLCSLNEASPVSILEALACEVPVAATDVGSVSESIRPGQTGWLFPSEDVDAMAASIEKLLLDPAQRHAMGIEGRQLVLDSGSLQSMVSGYQNLMTTSYDRVARKPRRVSSGVGVKRKATS